MKQNTASWDRIFRAVAGLGMLIASVFAPFPLLVRVIGLGGGGVYMLATALVGTCLGYRMMGISTCPASQKRQA